MRMHYWMCVFGICVALTQSVWADLGVKKYTFDRMLSSLNTSTSVGANQLGLVKILTKLYGFEVSQAGELGLIKDESVILTSEITEKSYVFPNPFRFSQGAHIGYTLSKSMDVKLMIYDMFGRLIYSGIFSAGSEGALGSPHYNRISIDSVRIGRPLPSGVYFYYLLHDKEVLDKGKMMVMP